MAIATSGTEVLEFRLGDGLFCLELGEVEEIVRGNDTLSRLPDAPRSVLGVMDLRGTTTTIVDPSLELDVRTGDGPLDPDLIMVLRNDSDSRIGWVVSEVTRTVTVTDEELDESITNDTVKGAFANDGGFTFWIEPKRFE
jgi:purine-binding chemotaxis protein CheW